MGLLPWAQEVPSSNLGASTKTSRAFSAVYRKLTSRKTNLWNSRRQVIRRSETRNARYEHVRVNDDARLLLLSFPRQR